MVRARIALLLSILLVAGLAEAQEQGGDPSFCEGDAECGQHYNLARQLSKKGDTERAIDEYRSTYGRKPFPPLLFNIARLYHKSGKLSQAILHYKWYLDSPSAGDEAQRDQARRYFAEAINDVRADTVLPEQPMPQPSTPPSSAQSVQPQSLDQPMTAPVLPPNVASVAPVTPPPRTTENRPIYKRWWLWTIVGVVVAGGVAGAVAGSLAANNSPPDIIRANAPVYTPTF